MPPCIDQFESPQLPKDHPISNATLRIPPFPNASHVYLIVAGILLGVLAGPTVLGRFAPDGYRAVFDGPDLTAIETEREDAEARFLADVEGIDVTPDYVQERLDEIQMLAAAKIEDGQRRQLERAAVLVVALVLGLLLMMILEAVLAPDTKPGEAAEVPPTLGRLITVRYALAGLVIAVLVGSPVLLWAMPKAFAVLIILVALVVGLIPLGGSTKPAS